MAVNLARNTFNLTLAAVGQKILAFIYFMIIARIVGVENTGVYFFALSYTTIFSIFVDFGLNSVLIRETAKNPALITKYLNNVFSIKLVFAVLTSGAAITIGHLMGYDSLKMTMIYLALLVMLADSFHLTFYGIFRGLKILSFEAIGIFVSEIIIVGFGVSALFFFKSLPLLIVALLCGSIFHVVYTLILLKRRVGRLPRLEFDMVFLKRTMKIALPFALAGVSVKVYSYIDSVLLERLAGDIFVGWYSIAYKFTYAFQFIPLAFVAGLYPVLSTYWKENHQKLVSTFEQSMRYMMIIAAPICFGAWSIADKIVLTFYGQDYFNSILPLQILIFVLFAIFVDFPVGSLLNACDRQATKTGIMIVTMVINVILNAILIPHYNVVGAAIAGLSSFTFMLIAGLFFSKRIVSYSLKNVIINSLRVITAGALMAVVAVFLKPYLHFSLIVPLGALLYFSVLYAIGGYGLKDISSLKKLLLKKG
jgi:O-antigen/teichoic acid export membrane protein